MSQPLLNFKRCNQLDGLRGIAILLVLLFHVVNRVAWSADFLPWVIYKTGRLGWFGADLFLVLSGYLITKKLLTKPTTRTFFANRLKRIVPLYAVLIGSYLIYQGHSHGMSWQNLALVTGLQSLYWSLQPITDSYLLGHLWFVSVIGIFYVIAFIICRLFKPATIFKMVLPVCFLVLMGRLGFTWTGHYTNANYLNIFLRFDILMLGMQLAVSEPLNIKPLWMRHAKTYFVLAVILFVSCALIHRDFQPTSFPMDSFGLTASAFMAVLILYFAKDCSWPWLGHKRLRAIGKHSYFIYLFQLPILAAILKLPVIENDYLSLACLYGITLSICMSLCWVLDAIKKHY